jgi:ankyrin repeat protein
VGMCGRVEPSAMAGIWGAAREGDVDEVARLLGQDPGLLDCKGGWNERTPLMFASYEGHVGVVRLLLDKGAAVDERDALGWTALFLGSSRGRTPVVRLLVESGADPTIANSYDRTPLMVATAGGELEIVRCLLDHPSAAATINRRDQDGETALWYACYLGHGGVARLLLERGADPTMASNDGTTPMARAGQAHPDASRTQGRRESAKALKVRCSLGAFLPHL